MKYRIKYIQTFEKQFKKLIKKYPSLKQEITNLTKELEVKPDLGIHIGKNCYKIKISIASKGRGKSGGARIITHFLVERGTIYLMSIYDKSNKDTIYTKELDELLCRVEKASVSLLD